MGGLYGTDQSLIWTPLWFLTHLWVASILAFLCFYLVNFLCFYLVKKGAENDSSAPKIHTKYQILSQKRQTFVGFVVVCGALALLRCSPYLLEAAGERGWPWSLDLLPVSLFFLILGRYLSTVAKTFNPSVGLLFLAVLGFFTAKSSGAFVSLNFREYTPLAWATIGALCGTYCLLTLAYLINWLAKISQQLSSRLLKGFLFRIKTTFAYIGSNSLYIAARIFG